MTRKVAGELQRREPTRRAQESELDRAMAGELDTLRRAIGARVGPEREPLASYRRDYEATVAQPAEPIPLDDFVEAAAAADLVLVGDYHTLPSAQQVALALARELLRRRGRLVLGLEMVRTEHQEVLDAWSQGLMSDTMLRNLIRFDARWPFPWSSYAPLLAFGREPGVALLALDGRGGLPARDALAARHLIESRARRSDVMHLVLIGDLHLAASHLPALLKTGRPDDRLAVIHQNIPAVHEKLALLGSRARATAATLGGDHFCLITASPVERERSYLAWLDGADHEETADRADEVARIAERLAGLVGRPELAAGVRGLEVVVRGAAGFLRDLEGRGMPFGRLVGIRRQIFERGTAVPNPHGPLYVGQPDTPHFAAAAAHLLQVRAGEPLPGADRADSRWREADLLAALRREMFAVLAWRLVEPLAGAIGEPFAVAFDPAAGRPPLAQSARVERRGLALRARIAAHLAGRLPSFSVPPVLLAEPAAVRAAVARAAATYYADGIRDAILAGATSPAAAADLLAPPPPFGRPRERRAVLVLAGLARAARRKN